MEPGKAGKSGWQKATSGCMARTSSDDPIEGHTAHAARAGYTTHETAKRTKTGSAMRQNKCYPARARGGGHFFPREEAQRANASVSSRVSSSGRESTQRARARSLLLSLGLVREDHAHDSFVADPRARLGLGDDLPALVREPVALRGVFSAVLCLIGARAPFRVPGARRRAGARPAVPQFVADSAGP